jgi:hypothetical protein
MLIENYYNVLKRKRRKSAWGYPALPGKRKGGNISSFSPGVARIFLRTLSGGKIARGSIIQAPAVLYWQAVFCRFSPR